MLAGYGCLLLQGVSLALRTGTIGFWAEAMLGSAAIVFGFRRPSVCIAGDDLLVREVHRNRRIPFREIRHVGLERTRVGLLRQWCLIVELRTGSDLNLGRGGIAALAWGSAARRMEDFARVAATEIERGAECVHGPNDR
jgi:hypothetical protein